MAGRTALISGVFGGLLLTAACEGPQRDPVIGEAYAGAAAVPIRQEINPRSAVVATAPRGEKLAIIQQRRRFYKVRTEKGAEGWTDERMLLSSREVAGLKALADQARNRPSQGVATTFEPLNVHSEPNRPSPSFIQIQANEKVDVLARAVTPRSTQAGQRVLVSARQNPAPRKATKKPVKEPKIPPPPMPAAPKLPAGWLSISKSPFPAPERAPASAEPIPMDDWTLVRTASGATGWVLTRRLFMAIPDEVAQYAEGRRITSYFSLGEVRDGDKRKPTWLWTTVERGLEPHDFDGMRVFVWSIRRHRYETAYIERNLTGYYPTLVHSVETPASMRGRQPQGTTSVGFSVLIRKKDGLLYRRTYAYRDNLVRFAQDERAPEPKLEPAPQAGENLVAQAQSEPEALSASFVDRVKNGVGAIRKRVFGR